MPTHPMLASDPAISLNQIFSRAGIPKRFRSAEKNSRALSADALDKNATV
jgi:hypothetical protein